MAYSETRIVIGGLVHVPVLIFIANFIKGKFRVKKEEIKETLAKKEPVKIIEIKETEIKEEKAKAGGRSVPKYRKRDREREGRGESGGPPEHDSAEIGFPEAHFPCATGRRCVISGDLFGRPSRTPNVRGP